MEPPKRRSPAEKKALSYARDCRNSFGENDKASRKAIPARKAMESRKVRRNANQALGVHEQLDDAAAALVESSLKNDIERVGGWRKDPDRPLGLMIERTRATRERKAGARQRRRADAIDQADEQGGADERD
jgi:hypothetical protein